MLKMKTKLFFKDLWQESQNKNILILSSSSSFFFFLCLIPTTLLVINFLNLPLPLISPNKTDVLLEHIKNILPEAIMPAIKDLFSHSKTMAQQQKKTHLIHLLMLIFSSLGFFGSVWKSFEILTNKNKKGTLTKTLKSFALISMTFFLIFSLLSLPMLLEAVLKLLELNLSHLLPFKDTIISFVQTLKSWMLAGVTTFLLFLFFYFILRYLFKKETSNKSILIGSLFFIISTYMAKLGFYSILGIIKETLVLNYGQLYSFLLFVFWSFCIILSFNFTVILINVLNKHLKN